MLSPTNSKRSKTSSTRWAHSQCRHQWWASRCTQSSRWALPWSSRRWCTVSRQRPRAKYWLQACPCIKIWNRKERQRPSNFKSRLPLALNKNSQRSATRSVHPWCSSRAARTESTSKALTRDTTSACKINLVRTARNPAKPTKTYLRLAANTRAPEWNWKTWHYWKKKSNKKLKN